MLFVLVITATTANTTLLSCLQQGVCVMGDGTVMAGVDCWGNGQQTERFKEERRCSRQKQLHTCRPVRVGRGNECQSEAHLSSSHCMIIDCETVEDRHNSLRAGTDGLVLPELTGSANCVSTFGADRSQMGGRIQDVELRVMQKPLGEHAEAFVMRYEGQRMCALHGRTLTK